MARIGSSLTWKSIFVICFVSLCLLLYGNSLFVWRQTTIMITANPSNYNGNHHNYKHQNMKNKTVIKSLQSVVDSDEIKINSLESYKTYNLYRNPYENIARSIYLQFVKEKDYLSLSKCLSLIDKDNRFGQCRLSKYILFDIFDVIGTGNHGKILSVNIEYKGNIKNNILNIDIDKINKPKRYVMKYSEDNETCSILQFEYNIMTQIQSLNNMEIYHLTDLHILIPWIEWFEINRFTRKGERKCILVMELIENAKTFEGIIKKQYPPSFEYDNGLIPFLLNCYNDLMIGLQRLYLFNYYHIDINGVNIMVWPRKNITSKRKCYLIDYGGIFAMNFDAKTDKLFTGKSHTYSPFAYYNLYHYELRKNKTNWNSTKLNYFARKDNQYRVIVELIRFYLEYAGLQRNISFNDNQWEYIKNAKSKQHIISHIKPAGINPYNQTYIQLIWCLRQTQIDNIRSSNLGTIYSEKHKKQFFKLLDILENATKETNAINHKLCTDINKF